MAGLSLQSILPHYMSHHVHWKRLGFELLLEVLMVLAPTSLDVLAQMGEYLLENSQVRLNGSICAIVSPAEETPDLACA